jgi:predicted lysophospholipase L1 biosynthesis ABC-type transport system permease subunit
VQGEDPGGRRFTVRVVGEVLVSPLVVNDVPELGDSGLITQQTAKAHEGDPPFVSSQFLVRFRPGADREAALARLRREFPDAVLTAVKPADVLNLERIHALPWILAALLALVAVGTVAHGLLTSTAGRRREIAALRSLGFVGSQVLRTVWWQALVIVGIAVAVGVPLGLALGRVSWNLLAHELTVSWSPRIPLVGLSVLVASTLVLALAAAAVPAVRAASTSPSLALRTE